MSKQLLTSAISGLVMLGVTLSASPSAQATGDVLVIGSISRSIKEEIETFQPLADYLGPRLEAVGIRSAKIAVVTTASEMARRLANGEIDIYIDSPIIAAQISRKSGAKPFLRRWKKGVAEYQTLFVTRQDSDIKSLDDLLGRVVAFDDPHSSSGYLLPKAMLMERGYRLVQVTDPGASVPPDAIGYVFSMDDVNTMFWVDRGKVDAGVTSPGFLKKYGDRYRNRLRVLASSMKMPRHVVVHRGDLDPAVVRELERVLTGMEHDEAGRKTLKAFQKTTRFDRFPDGVEATFAPIYAMLDILDLQLTN